MIQFEGQDYDAAPALFLFDALLEAVNEDVRHLRGYFGPSRFEPPILLAHAELVDDGIAKLRRLRDAIEAGLRAESASMDERPARDRLLIRMGRWHLEGFLAIRAARLERAILEYAQAGALAVVASMAAEDA